MKTRNFVTILAVFCLTSVSKGTAMALKNSGLQIEQTFGWQALDKTLASALLAGGDFVWAKSMGGEDSDCGESIAVDTSGNVYTIGSFYAPADFDPGPGIFNLTSGYTYISKLDPNGNFLWAKSIDGTGFDIALDLSGNIYITSGVR